MCETNLIRHNHKLSVPKVSGILVVLVVLQTENLLDVLNLLVLHDLIVFCFTYIKKFSTQREYSKIITPDNTQPSNGKSLG